MQAFVVPALRNVREERGTRFVGTVKEIKGLGHPSYLLLIVPVMAWGAVLLDD